MAVKKQKWKGQKALYVKKRLAALEWRKKGLNHVGIVSQSIQLSHKEFFPLPQTTFSQNKQKHVNIKILFVNPPIYIFLSLPWN